ncbi:hypothetical protein COO60DRAFT_954062 [Scenedesmus sp. NREL 46B-D3]|nr:hypothetical protein COO60DRAFT_954062 [Scenedesmus sp. NREL 46B-D3]
MHAVLCPHTSCPWPHTAAMSSSAAPSSKLPNTPSTPAASPLLLLLPLHSTANPTPVMVRPAGTDSPQLLRCHCQPDRGPDRSASHMASAATAAATSPTALAASVAPSAEPLLLVVLWLEMGTHCTGPSTSAGSVVAALVNAASAAAAAAEPDSSTVTPDG